MATKTLIASAIVVSLMATPTLAEENAHHYLGGPKTGISHLTKHPAMDTPAVQKKTRYTFRAHRYHAHRYQGGPTSPTLHNPK
jgi:hypothetical protein